MGQLIFEAYDGNDPNGTPLGVLTEAEAKVYTAEHNDLGTGSFTINRHSSQLEWCRPDRYIKVYRDTTASDPIGAFWVTQSGDTVVSAEEEGGESSNREGLGPMLYLAEAIVWYESVTGNDSAVPEDDAYWHWENMGNVHAGGILVRMLEEAQARGALPDLTYDFTRQLDSNGTPWSIETTDFQLPVGMNLLEVLRKVQETGVEFRMDPDLTLHAYEPDTLGSDLSGTITLEKAVDITTSAERQVVASPLRSTQLVKGKRGDTGAIAWVEVDSAAGLSETGRRKEGFLDAPETTGFAVLQAMGSTQVYRHLRRKAGPTLLGVLELEGQVPFEDYRESDIVTVTVPGTWASVEKRITSLSLKDTEAGEYDVVVGFDEDPGRDSTGPTDGGVVEPPPGGPGGQRPCNDCPPEGPFVPEYEEGAAVSAVLWQPRDREDGGSGAIEYAGSGDAPPGGYPGEPKTGPITYTMDGSEFVGFGTTEPLLATLHMATATLVAYTNGMTIQVTAEIRVNGTAVAFDIQSLGPTVGFGNFLANIDLTATDITIPDGALLTCWMQVVRNGAAIDNNIPNATGNLAHEFRITGATSVLSNAPTPGQVVTEQAISDGATVELATNYPYAENSIEVHANGVLVPVIQTDPASGAWELPEEVPDGTVLVIRYQALGAALGTGNAVVQTAPQDVPHTLLGTGGDGSGANILHDNGTWSPETGAPFGALGWYNVEDYGAVHDGTTDDTPAIQAAINAASAAGGGTIYFPAGIYQLDGALQSTSTYNAQITIPQRNVVRPDGAVVYRFLGATPGYTNYEGTAASSILRSSWDGTISGTPAIISLGLHDSLTMNWSVLVFEDIEIRAHRDPKLTAIDATKGGGVRFKNLTVSVDWETDWELPTDWTPPSHSNSVGVDFPRGYQDLYSGGDGLNVQGYYTGFRPGEQFTALGVWVGFCTRAVDFKGEVATGGLLRHANYIARLEVFFCPTGIVFSGDDRWVWIGMFGIEHEDSVAAAWANVRDISDPSNYGHGMIGWHTTEWTAGPLDELNIDGGDNLSLHGALAKQWRLAGAVDIPTGTDPTTNPTSGRRLYAASATGNLTARKPDGTTVDLEAGGSVDAEDVAYDNGTSGLAAADVQAAIDELAGAGAVAGLIQVDAGAAAYDTSTPGELGITITSDWGVDAGVVYYDDTGAAAGEEAALFYDPATGQYTVIAYEF